MMGQVYSFNKGSLWALVGLLLLAAWLRLDDPDAGEFQYDQAELSSLALQGIKDGEWPTKGMLNSRGIYHTPAMAYVMALPFALNDHPTSVMICLRLWHILGVGLFFAFLWRFSGPRVAIIGGLAYACNPWAILYSSFIWNVNLIYPFLIGSMWLMLEGLQQRRLWPQAWAIGLFSLVPQIHFSGLTLIPLWLWMLWWGRRGLRWGGLALGVLVALLTLIPFGLGLTQADIADYRAFFFGQEMAESPRRLTFQPLERAANLVAGLDVEQHLVFEHDPAPLLQAAPRWEALWGVLVLLAGLGLLWGVWHQTRLTLFLGLWFILPILGTLDANRTAAHYHYLMLLLPVGCWAIGLSSQWRPAPYRWAVYALVGGIALSQGLWWREASAYVADYTLSSATPYRYLNPIRERLQAFEDVVIVGGGATTGTHVWKPLLYDTPCLRDLIASDSALAVFPARPFAVLYPPDAQINAVDPLARDLYIVGQGEIFYLRQNETPYRVYEYPQAPAFPLPITPIPPQRFDVGATLTGYRLEPTTLYLEWQLGQPADDENTYTYFAHFLDSAGERIGQRDAGFWPSRYWCAGDRLVVWTTITLPPETVALRIGLYQRYPDGGIVNRNVVDASGNPGGQWAEITLP